VSSVGIAAARCRSRVGAEKHQIADVGVDAPEQVVEVVAEEA
jgi:hypothetical protein